MSGIQSRTTNDLDQALAALELLLRAGGEEPAEDDREILLAFGSDLHAAPAAYQDRLGIIYEAARRGFFHCAATGTPFLPMETFDEEFGRSIEDNYPGAGVEFARMARSYWTLSMLEARLRLHFAGVAAQQVLLGVVAPVGETFFRDLADRDPGEVADVQRRMIEQSGAPIDVESFLFGNPLLMGNPLA